MFAINLLVRIFSLKHKSKGQSEGSPAIQLLPHAGQGKIQPLQHTGQGKIQPLPHTGQGKIQHLSHVGQGKIWKYVLMIQLKERKKNRMETFI